MNSEMDKASIVRQSTAIVLPSLDPDRKFSCVVKGLVEDGFQHIIIVDDGSDEAHQHWFTEAAEYSVCTVLHHGVNKGKGRALKTAFGYVRKDLPELLGVITIDGDGQHLLSDIVARGELEKTYAAYLTPAPDLPLSGEMRDLLFFDRKRDKAFVLDPAKDAGRKGAKEAALRYELVRRFEWRGKSAAEARVELLTGRTHQIRAQFGARKSPLLGDGKYGSRVNYKGPSLFSVGLAFPWEGEKVQFEYKGEAFVCGLPCAESGKA